MTGPRPPVGTAGGRPALEKSHLSVLRFNGLDPVGAPLFDDRIDHLIEGIRHEGSPFEERRLTERWQKFRPKDLSLKEGNDPRRLDEAGWGVILAEDATPSATDATLKALAPLLEHRRHQMVAHRFRIFSGRAGYRRGETSRRFLARHGSMPGPVDPDRVPYYLLLVGSAEQIPFDFQYTLDLFHAVGRIVFDDTFSYRAYAEKVVATELCRESSARRAAFFGTREAGDATELTHDQLLEPLVERLQDEARDWSIETALGEQATHRRLGRFLGSREAPSLLFTACHGLGFRSPDPPQQEKKQGALFCVDRPFTAADLSRRGVCSGNPSITFALACYSAGTPRLNGFRHRGETEAEILADRPFVARLPRALLAMPRSGALAVIGHVDRAWTWSFRWPGVGPQIEVFASTLHRLLAGHPVGSAMDIFNQRFAGLEVELAGARGDFERGECSQAELLGLWTARNDARSFVVLGDPAVRLPGTVSKDVALES